MWTWTRTHLLLGTFTVIVRAPFLLSVIVSTSICTNKQSKDSYVALLLLPPSTAIQLFLTRKLDHRTQFRWRSLWSQTYRRATWQLIVVSWRNANISRRHIIYELCHSSFHKFHSLSFFLHLKSLFDQWIGFDLITLMVENIISFLNKELCFFLIVFFLFHFYSIIRLN